MNLVAVTAAGWCGVRVERGAATRGRGGWDKGK